MSVINEPAGIPSGPIFILADDNVPVVDITFSKPVE